VKSELKHHKNDYAYYQKIVVSYNYVTISVQASVLLNCRIESNRIKSFRQRESNRLEFLPRIGML